MSYATMDHGGWVQQQIPHWKARAEKRRSDCTKGPTAAPDQLTDFQLKVFDIIGISYGGIYNAPVAWDAVRWKGWADGIAVPVRGGMATFDGQVLTSLVLLCHEARIRLDIDPHGFGYLLLQFWPRQHEGGIGRRHPNIDEAVAGLRRYLPPDHRLIYRTPAERDDKTLDLFQQREVAV